MNLFEMTANEVTRHRPELSPVLLPLGPTQPHGPHLPVGTSTMVAETLAAAAIPTLKAAGLSPVVAPTLPYAAAEITLGLPGCLSINARVFAEVLYEIGQAFHREGFRWLALVNVHLSLDHLKAMSQAVTDLNRLPGFVAFDPLSPWLLGKRPTLAESLRRMGLDPSTEFFADVVETSTMLHIAPDLVDRESLPQLPPYLASLSWETLKGHFSLTEMGARDGYIGSPAQADPRLGEWYVETAGKVLADAIAGAMQGRLPPSLPMVVRLLMRMVDLDDAG